MKDRTPIPREQRPALPDFAPVPRKHRHDGWTPERQRAFIEALADTGSVSRACAMVNMSTFGAYYLRRQKGADEFRRAWEAALDYGVARMKDIAFERAIEGYLVPCFVGGKLLGCRRKYNDRLLMFCLRHYGEDASGKRTKVEYFSTRATAGAQSSTLSSARGGGPSAEERMVEGSHAMAEASTTTVKTVTSGKGTAPNLDATTILIDNFAGVELDAPAQAEIARILTDCAARRRAVEGTPDDPDERFISVEQPEKEVLVHDPGYKHPRKVMRRPTPPTDVVVEAEAFLEQSPKLLVQPEEVFKASDAEFDWQMLDQEEEMAAIEEAVESVKRAKENPPLLLQGRGTSGAGGGASGGKRKR